MSEMIKTRNNSFYVYTVIMFIFMFGFGFLPPFGQVTPMGMKVLGIFIGLLWGWITIDLLFPSILSLIAFGSSGYMDVAAAYCAGLIANQCVPMLIIMMIFSELLIYCRLTEWVAAKCLSLKIIIGRPWIFISIVLAADLIISVLGSNLAAMFVLWTMFTETALLVGYQKGDKEISYMICAIAFVSVLGANILPFREAPIMFSSFLTNGVGMTIPYGGFLLFMLLISICEIVLLLLAGKFVFRLDMSKFSSSDDRFAHLRGQKATFEQKMGMLFILLLIVIMLAAGFLPKSLAITGLLNNWGLIGVASLILIGAYLLKNNDGGEFVNIGQIAKRGVSWEIIFLLVATFPLAEAMRNADCGILATVLQAVTPLFGDMPVFVFMAVSGLVLAIVTQVVHNVVLAAMFIPMLSEICLTMGGNPITLFFICYLALQIAFATPGASMQGAMMFGNADLPRKHGYLFGTLFTIINLLTMCTLGYILGNVIFQ